LVSGKLTTFYKIKECFRREPYLSVLNSDQRSLITKFRISAHQLRIETGRYERKKNQAVKISILEGVKPVIQPIRAKKKVVPFKEKSSFHFVVL
jgi:hypothetical protein